MPTSCRPCKRAAACSSSCAANCRGVSASVKCGGCATPKNATPPWRCAAGTATGSAKRSAGTATTDRLHTGDPIAMADDAITAYKNARSQGHDAAIICDKWEIADAINLRLHRDNRDVEGPAVRVARDQDVRAGDIIISRNNDISIPVAPGADHKRGDRIDQVRNGNRWRVAVRRRRQRPDRGRTAHRQSPRHLRGRLPQRTRHPRLRHHPARRPRHHRRQLHHPRGLLHRAQRPRQPRDGLRRHDPRQGRKPRLHLPAHHRRSATTNTATSLPAGRSTRCGAATNTPPRTTSA